jgi:lipid-A-disaccharide synthase
MKPKTVMIVAGEASGDALAADLTRALAAKLDGARFIGAGGRRMAEAGVDCIFDLTEDAVIGVVLKKLPLFRRRMKELTRLAVEQKPELVVLVDFSGFNRRLGHAIRRACGRGPKIVQFVSPQVWASRPGRADKMARDFDLLLCLFPFEKEWYARRTPGFRVEWVGHPMFDKYKTGGREEGAAAPTVVLLPGSRLGELKRHLPVVFEAAELIAAKQKARFKLVAPSEEMAGIARDWPAAKEGRVEVQTGGLEEALSTATIAITKTGTVTLECAWFGVPTVAFYKTDALTYAVGKQIVTVKYAAFPNLLADRMVFPEFIQHEATGRNMAAAALELLGDEVRRRSIRAELRELISTLGGPGAAGRAAAAILDLFSLDAAAGVR